MPEVIEAADHGGHAVVEAVDQGLDLGTLDQVGVYGVDTLLCSPCVLIRK